MYTPEEIVGKVDRLVRNTQIRCGDIGKYFIYNREADFGELVIPEGVAEYYRDHQVGGMILITTLNVNNVEI